MFRTPKNRRKPASRILINVDFPTNHWSEEKGQFSRKKLTQSNLWRPLTSKIAHSERKRSQFQWTITVLNLNFQEQGPSKVIMISQIQPLKGRLKTQIWQEMIRIWALTRFWGTLNSKRSLCNHIYENLWHRAKVRFLGTKKEALIN